MSWSGKTGKEIYDDIVENYKSILNANPDRFFVVYLKDEEYLYDSLTQKTITMKEARKMVGMED